MAKHYGIPVVIHSDHCAKKLLEWFDGMLEADEAYFKEHKEPLFSRYDFIDSSFLCIDFNTFLSCILH